MSRINPFMLHSAQCLLSAILSGCPKRKDFHYIVPSMECKKVGIRFHGSQVHTSCHMTN